IPSSLSCYPHSCALLDPHTFPNTTLFRSIYATQGSLAGPNFSTDIMGTFFFRTFFGFQLQPGDPHMGAAVAGMMFLIILTGVLLYLFGWQRRMERIEY